MVSHVVLKKIVRDVHAGLFVGPGGTWTCDESQALNLQNAFEITRLRYESAERKLELIIKFADGAPTRSFALP